MSIKKHITIICFLLVSCFCFSQNEKQENDSTTVYHDIQNFSKKNNFSKFFYKLIFRPSALEKKVIKTVSKPSRPLKKNNHYNGKVIRNIKINTLDPFGYSITDSLKKPKKTFEKFGNKVHIKSKNFTIRNLLLFKKNDRYDDLLIQESERLIRSQRYTRRVAIETIELETTKDSVDIVVNVLDSWSLIPNGSISSNQGSFNLKERNVLGLGHQIYGKYKERFSDNENAISGQYTINNIKNTYLRFDLNYDNDFDNNSRRSLSLSRNFYSPLTKWAGGLYFENQLQNEYFNQIIIDSSIISTVRTEYQDFWIGRSFKVFNQSDYNFRTTKLITSITYNKRDYFDKPDINLDPEFYFSNEKNTIIQIGLSSQKYYKDKFIFNYDITEDVPFGQIAALNFGYQEKNEVSRLYFGIKLAYGKKFKFGYLSGFTEWGNFFNNGIAQETAFRLEFNYFTNLLPLGKWKFRQFVKPSYIWGNNRNLSEKDKLTLNENLGIQGFNSPIIGTQKWLLNLQTQTYSPGSWYGFRFSPYLNATFGALSNSNKNLFNSKIYSKFGIGVLINNDYLVFNSFQISFSYYPTIPFEGDNIIKTNSFENTDLSLPSFQLTKPSYIEYR